ncbi:MAG: response regulator [Anaerolineae bacterium]
MNATILIVDDDFMNREILQAHMNNAGYDVLTANNGNAALQVMKTQVPDLVLMDVRMPGMNGYELCAYLKAQPETRHLPVLLMTAMDDEENLANVKAAGADGFISKPFNAKDIRASIVRLLGL